MKPFTSWCLCAAGSVVLACTGLATASAATHTAPSRCSESNLAESAGSTRAVTGVEGVVVVVRNYGTKACSLRGYPKVIRGRKNGTKVASREEHGSTMLFKTHKVRTLTLQPGSAASFGVSYTDHPVGTSTCNASTRLLVKVIAADHRITVRTESLHVCGGQFTVSALQAGAKGPRP